MAKPYAELSWAKDLAVAIQAGIVGYAVGGAFLAMSLFDLFYHFIAMMIVTYSITLRELAKLRERQGNSQVEIGSRPALAPSSSRFNV